MALILSSVEDLPVRGLSRPYGVHKSSVVIAMHVQHMVNPRMVEAY